MPQKSHVSVTRVVRAVYSPASPDSDSLHYSGFLVCLSLIVSHSDGADESELTMYVRTIIPLLVVSGDQVRHPFRQERRPVDLCSNFDAWRPASNLRHAGEVQDSSHQ